MSTNRSACPFSASATYIPFKALLTGALLILHLQAFSQIAPYQPTSDTLTIPIAFMRMLSLTSEVSPDSSNTVLIPLPAYTQGLFCDLEDAMNRNRRLRIDLGVK